MATTTSPPSSSSWKPTGRHNVYLGKSFVNSLQMRKGIQPKVNGKFPPSIYHSVRYNFRPSSIDSDAAGTLTLKTAGSEKTPVLAEHPSTQQGEMHMFNGSEIPTKDSLCTLIYNAATGHYTLEKIDSVINLDYIEKKQISAPQPSTSFEDEFAEILPDNIKPYRKEEEEEEGELLVEPFHRDPSPPIREPSPPPKPKKAPPKSKLPPKPKLEPKAQPKPKPEPKRPKAEPKTSTSKPPTPIERAKASLKRPSPEVEEFGSITKPPPAKKARQSLSRPAPPPPPRQPAKLELPGMSSSFIQPLPGPSTFSAPAAPPTLSIPEDSDEEEDWDEVPAPGALEPSQDMDMFTQLLENQLDEEAPEDEEDFLLEGMEEIDGDEQEQEQEQGGPQVPMSLNQYAGVEFGVDDDDFSSSGSEDEDD